MAVYKEPSFADRQKTARKARKNTLEKFQAQPGPDDPAVKQRQAERESHAANREKMRQARETEKADAAAKAAAQLTRDKAEAAAAQAALGTKQKAARDARYAARKARRK